MCANTRTFTFTCGTLARRTNGGSASLLASDGDEWFSTVTSTFS